MRASGTRWFMVLAALLLVTPGRASSMPPVSAMVRVPGHVLPALARATKVAPQRDESNEPITLTIVLKRDDQAGFEKYLHEIYDPHSKNFHHYLTQRRIADRFGPSRADYDGLLRYMRAHGFTLTQGSKNRLTLTVRGIRAAAERAFDVNIREYRIGQREFYANAEDPALPASLASHVQAIAGTSDFARPHHAVAAIVLALGLICWSEIGLPGYNNALCPVAICFTVFEAAAAAACPVCQIPNNSAASLAKACSSSPSPGASQLLGESLSAPSLPSEVGAGQKIGLVEFDNFHPSDVSNYISLIGAPATEIANLSEVNVNGGVSPGSDEDEVLLDIDAELTLAPGAQTVVYDAPFAGAGGSFQPVFNQMISDGVSIISNSWAYCEDQTTQADVDSIDSIFQQAAAAGISVFNGSGDRGSTCLDGSANTIGVPADSPNATAVGGTSLTVAPGGTYQSETWWDGQTATPPTGQGGFGVSKFFAAPTYQTGLTGGRSVPDVVENADPAHGIVTCQADAGGCPTGLMYSGTSVAAPVWAAFAAQLNQQMGKNLGFLNPLLYPLANTDSFHDAASMGSDIAHVGLGSPNLDALGLALSGQSAGAVSASASIVAPLAQAALLQSAFEQGTSATYVPADGSSDAFVVVQLLDANGHLVGGKTVTLTSDSASAKITPSSVMTSSANGTAQFTVTDLNAENVTFTATDSSDGMTLAQQPMVVYGVPPAAAAGLNVNPTSQAADGMSPVDITVTLQDSLGRPTPGKLIQINQTGGDSNIAGPTPPVTNSTGQVEFMATDTNNETITYSAVDVTDGNLPFPTTGMATFSDAVAPGCQQVQNAAPGFVVQAYATGFVAQPTTYGDVNFGCGFGTYGMAWDAEGNLYAGDSLNGNLYKIPPGGGVAGPSTLVSNVAEAIGGLAIDKNGNLYATIQTTPAGFNSGSVVQLDPSTGAIIKTLASNLTCPEALSIDPLSGDLFTDDSCSGSGSDNPSLWRISDPSGPTPTVSVYATLPNTPNANIGFAPDGTMYIWDSGQDVIVTGTNGPNPPVVTIAPNPTNAPLGSSFIGLLAFGTASTGGAQYLITNLPSDTSVTPTVLARTAVVDLSTSPPSVGNILATTGTQNLEVGPNGCVYMAQGVGIWRITDSTGACNYNSSLSLTPSELSTNPAQGTSVSLTAQFHDVSVPDGTPVTLEVSGANQRLLQSNAASGAASFSYTGAHQGIDTIVARAILNGASITSNPAVYTWGPGTDLTFLSLNQSPTSGVVSQAVTLTSNLTDISQKPAVALSGEQVNFSLGDSDCEGTTDANGNASCQVTPSSPGVTTLSANFAGASQYNASSDSRSFRVLPTPTIPPVAGKLKISPSRLNFGSVNVGSNKVDTVKVTNAGKTTKKSKALPIVIEMESVTPSEFAVTTSCEEQLAPGAKGERPGTCNVQVTFTPTAAMKYSGDLVIMDNVDPSLAKKYPALMQKVPLTGAGKAAK